MRPATRASAWGLALAALVAGCSGDDTAAPDAAAVGPSAPAPVDGAPAERAPARPRIAFEDATATAGLDVFRNRSGDPDKPFLLDSVGGGVALFDVDVDGDLDAYLVNGGHLEGFADGARPLDALFHNDGRGRFTRAADAGITHEGWGMGVRVADLDADGWPDLYVTNYGPNVLYANREGRFADVTAAAGVGCERWSTGASFLDHDRDGDLDLYVVNYVAWDEARMLAERPLVDYRGIRVNKGPQGLPAAADVFYENRGDGSFVEASARVGIDAPAAYGFQSVAFDASLDGWVDVLVANDSMGNFLWTNRGGERFEDTGFATGFALSMTGKEQAGMGMAVGDYDGDLVPDVFVTNFAEDYYTLYRGRAAGGYLDVSMRAGLALPTKMQLGWGCGFEDFDSDGTLEVFAVNGHVYPQVDAHDVGTTYRQANQLFVQADGRFRVPEGGGGPGFALVQASRGAAVGDVDGDGDLDLLIGNLDEPPALLRNESAGGAWIKVRVIGAGKNRDAVGARLVVRVGERSHLRLVAAGSGFLSSSDPRLHIGLGDAERADALEVTWPGGATDELPGCAAYALVTIEEVPGASPRMHVAPWASGATDRR